MASARKEKPSKGTAAKNRRDNGQPGEKSRRTDTTRPQMQNQPKNPFPRQKQEKPGIESRLTPRPEYKAPF